MMRKRIAGGARRSWALGAALVAAAATVARAQGTGNGYLFGQPSATLTIRGGWSHANASSDLFEQTTSEFNVNRSDFSGPTFGGQLGIWISPQLDASLDVAYAGVSRRTHYRNFVDNNNQEIEQTTTLQRVPVTANVRLYLAPRGRSIGTLAFIPARIVPWVGAGAGATWYRFKQTGDFIDMTSGVVSPDSFETSTWGPAVQGMGGVDLTITPRIALTGDARYLWSHAEVSGDFEGYNKIDLSGASFTLGVTFRL